MKQNPLGTLHALTCRKSTYPSKLVDVIFTSDLKFSELQMGSH